MNAVHFDALLARLPKQGRAIVAIAGAPGSGKSTLAEALADTLNNHGRRVQVVPMDGFHLDNRLLQARGLSHRKGAPETFDIKGFAQLIKRLRSEDEVIYPLFDRMRDIVVAGAGQVTADCDCVLVEGNYLLLDEPGWRELAALWDISIRLDVPEDILRHRLLQRWLDHGLDKQAAAERAEQNDLVNAGRVIAAGLPADMTWG